MLRRIYISFPLADQARRVVTELEQAGVKRDRIHTIARPDVDIKGMPSTNVAQRSDQVWLWERVFWYGNLALFGIALALAALALYAGSPGWAMISAMAAITTVILGERFAVKLPHVHLSEMRVPLANGEVILLVDVPFTRLREIEQLVTRRHPEAGLGGVGWTIAYAGI